MFVILICSYIILNKIFAKISLKKIKNSFYLVGRGIYDKINIPVYIFIPDKIKTNKDEVTSGF